MNIMEAAKTGKRIRRLSRHPDWYECTTSAGYSTGFQSQFSHFIPFDIDNILADDWEVEKCKEQNT